MKTLKFFIILSFTLCLAACAPKRNDYSEFINLNQNGWAYGDTIIFPLSHTDSIATGDLFLSLRHSTDYLYSNLWIEVTFNDADNHKYTDTVNIALADVYGNWNGKGAGISYQKQVLIKHNLKHLNLQPINVRHIMRTDTLKGIEVLGIDFVGIEKE